MVAIAGTLIWSPFWASVLASPVSVVAGHREK